MTKQVELYPEVADTFDITPTVYTTIQQITYIKRVVNCITEAIKVNSCLPQQYRLDLIQGSNFIRVNLVRTLGNTLIKNILIISGKVNSKASDSKQKENTEYIYKVQIDGQVRDGIGFSEDELDEYMVKILIPFIEGYNNIKM